MPAPREVPAKTVSPGRRTGLATGSAVGGHASGSSRDGLGVRARRRVTVGRRRAAADGGPPDPRRSGRISLPAVIASIAACASVRSVLGDRRRAGGLGGGLLALLAGDVGQEGLDEVAAFASSS